MNNCAQRLALGTAQFGFHYGVANLSGQITRPEAAEMLSIARRSGLDLLDTARGYGDSEECLGALDVHGFHIVTKFPIILDECSDIGSWIRAQVEAAIVRLKVEKIYGLLVHHSAPLLGEYGPELMEALEDLKDQGLVEKVGVSIYSPDELELLSGSFHPDIVQAPFNLIDRRLLSSGWLRRLKERGVEIHVRSVFLQGLLLMGQQDLPPQFAPWKSIFGRWHNWLEEEQASPLAVCLAFALQFPEIDRILVGADGSVQLQEVVDAAQVSFCGDFPDLESDEQGLINPSLWSK